MTTAPTEPKTTKGNVVKQRKFSELLQASLSKYINRSIEVAQVIEELVVMAKNFRDDADQSDKLGLTAAEKAFYDALAENDSAHDLMGEEVLVPMAKELADRLRKNLTVDWQYKDNVRAKLRILIRYLLMRYEHPPDQQPSATELVLVQAETLSEEMVATVRGDLD